MKRNSVKQAALLAAFMFTVMIPAGLFAAEEKAESVVYLEKLSKELNIVELQVWDYVKESAHSKNIKEVEKKRKKMIKSVTDAFASVKKIKPFNNDDTFQLAVLKYLDTMKLIMNEDYAKLVNMEEVAEQSYDLMEAYLLAKEKANQKLDDAASEVHAKQAEYAKKNNINLISVESESSKGLKLAGEVNDYYNEVYLLFFKAYKQEAYLLEAMRIGDLGKIEQNRIALVKAAEEGLKKLSKIKDYKKDFTLRKKGEEMLAFYKSEGAQVTAISDYMMKRDSFEKIKKAFGEKSEADKTKEDVELYNKKVDEMNVATDKANTVNTTLNTDRGKLLNEWNTACGVFFDTHVPK